MSIHARGSCDNLIKFRTIYMIKLLIMLTTFEILFLIILNFGNIFSRITTREATEINLCPFEYPNAYFNGTNCCKSQKNCQQKSLEFHNTCCNSADYVFCPFESGCDDCEFSRFRNKRLMLFEMFNFYTLKM